MCYLCVSQYTPIGGWKEPDRPPSHRYCDCPLDTHGHRHMLISSTGWVIVPYLRRHLTHTSTGIVHYGLLGIILGWCELPPYTIHRAPGQVRIVYRNGRRFHFQGCCIQIYAPCSVRSQYVRRSIRRGAGDLWSYNDPTWTDRRRKLH